MATCFGRRQFISALGGASLGWPLAARAQMPVIGFLGATALDHYTGPQVAAVRQALSEADFVDDRNIAIEFRWAEGHYDRLQAFADELVGNHVAVILASSLPSAVAAKQATSSIPIVFVMGADPVKLGVVPSLGRAATSPGFISITARSAASAWS